MTTNPTLSRVVLTSLVLGAALLGLQLPARSTTVLAPAAADTRPNIVLISADDMRAGDLRAMPQTRELVVQQGTSFARSYAPFSLCCPARASWLTGQYPHNNGVMGNGTPDFPLGGFAALDSSSTVATWLRAAGYQTGFVGKFLNSYGAVTPTVVPPGWDEWHAGLGINTYFSTAVRENHTGSLVTTRYDGTYQVDLYDRMARDLLQRRLAGPPLFLWLSHFAPHTLGPTEPDDPVDLPTPAVPPRWRDHYSGQPLPTSPSFNEADVSDKPVEVASLPLLSRAERAAVAELNTQRWESLRAVDDSVARVMRLLQAAGELENTVVVFTSDNGYELGEHRIRGGKVRPYEESSRVPLAIRGPGFPAGARLTALTANVDLAPTFAELARTATGLVVDGRSLLTLVANPTAWSTRAVALEAGPKDLDPRDLYHGVRTGRWTFVRHRTGNAELYDVAADPSQLQNLAADPAYADTVTRLSRLTTRLSSCAGTTCWS